MKATLATQLGQQLHLTPALLQSIRLLQLNGLQLEQEIRQNVWLTVDADEDLVFDAGHETKWARALGKLGIDPKFLSAEAGRA